jgi:cytochrome c peroxidase
MSAIALLAVFCALSAAAAGSTGALSADVAAPWRTMFSRPQGLPPSPPDNPLTSEKVALGSRLFADVRLSGRTDRSCASCHRPGRGFTDGRPRARAASGADLRRNTSSLWNLAWGKQFFWDGRAASLEAQVAMPVEAPQEMAGVWPTIIGRLTDDRDLAGLFEAAFPSELQVSQETIVKALASYVRSLVSPPTRFDAWIEGDAAALRPPEMRGFALFVGKAGCVLCHVGWRFTDDRFHDIGLRSRDDGRGALPGGTAGSFAFKTPGLRELASTAPYMHDGSFATLPAVVEHYSSGFVRRPSLAPHVSRTLRLNAREKSDLVAFLRSLSHDEGPARATRTRPD